MAFTNVHPRYTEFLGDWRQCRDCYRGERVIKSRGAEYLHPTASMWEDGYPNHGSRGTRDYARYLARAVFPAHMSKAIRTFLGMLWHKPPKLVMPSGLEYLREKATRRGETLDQLYRRIHEELLTTSRLGLLIDLPVNAGPSAEPYLALYEAESILNWDEGEIDQVGQDSLNLIVLDETDYVRNDVFSYEKVERYRVLLLGDPLENEAVGLYQSAVIESETSFNASMLEAPTWRGKTLDFIPFTFINSADLSPEPTEPFLLNLSSLDLAIYRGQADYRQSLHMQGQDTLVLTGVPDQAENEDEKPIRTGAGAVIRLTNPAADAKYIGVDGTGLEDQRKALENDTRAAEVAAAQLTDTRTNERESGDAMGKRMAGQTVTLVTIAHTAALGLQNALRQIATWKGIDPSAVEVTPNLEFGALNIDAAGLVQLMALKNAGGPITDRMLYEAIRKAGFSDEEYEDVIAELDSEEPRIGPSTQAMMDHEGATADRDGEDNADDDSE